MNTERCPKCDQDAISTGCVGLVKDGLTIQLYGHRNACRCGHHWDVSDGVIIPEVGARIRLLSMTSKKGKAVKPGTRGTVTEREQGEKCWALRVDWDTGSRLILTVPPDSIEPA